MVNYHPISSLLAKQLAKLPWVHSESHGRDVIRVTLFYLAGQGVFLLVVYELIYFTEFGAVTEQEAWWAWGLFVSFLTLFTMVSAVQALSYLDIYRFPYQQMHRHWLVSPSIIILYIVAVMLAAVVNSEGVDAALMLLPLVTLSALVQVYSLFMGLVVALTATICASVFYPDFPPVSAAYIFMQQAVLMVMTRSFISERYAREDLLRRNDELSATQTLLSEASRQNERLRIARNIHDLVGHHVTALSLNLETLSHKVNVDLKQEVDAVQEIAKDLLSKVRLAVTEYRMDVAMPVRDILSELTSHAPSLNIELDLEDDLVIRDAALAELILRSCQEIITNTLKHSTASSLFIQLHRHHGFLQLMAMDDGEGMSKVIAGNGLTGMKERADQLGGSITYDTVADGGFKVSLKIPLNGGDL